MGVTGLWTVVQPCARPVKLETLAQRRLAIDASIWIYQFLKAVRDKEGNALRNAHVVGFFRRIVKLLFHGIRPVFVFDGGAPLLKRQTIANRKSHRQGRKEDASNTARKLLSLQMQKKAKEEVERRKQAVERQLNQIQEEEPVPENPVYASELFQKPEERRVNRTAFRKTDQYHLPEMDHSIEAMRGINDPRIMSMEELEAYARRFEGGEDINLYDFSKIDFDSPFFTSLPAADRYNILNAARIRSRLRMGLSKEQLEQMFPNRLEFSRFQIERVRERNDLTQRLMNLNGMNDDLISVRRVAGEKDREYVLVKNEGAEGGWALGVVGQKGVREGEAPHKAIDLDADEKNKEDDDEWEDEVDEFEDIPIEGLNRLPKPRTQAFHNIPHRRRNSEEREIQRAIKLSKQEQQKNALKGSNEAPVFIQDDELSEFDDAANEYEELFQDLDGFEQDLEKSVDDEDELRRAIAMSLEKDKKEGEEEEKALELAIRMSLEEQSSDNEPGPSTRPLNPTKPKFVEQPLNPSKPRFMEFGSAASYSPANKRDTLPPAKSNEVVPLNKSKLAFTEIQTAEPVNPFTFEDGGFTLEDAMTKPFATAAEESESSRKDADFNLDSNLLPFESMKLGGFAGLEKRLQAEKSQESGQSKTKETENPVETLPPWFSAQENATFKAGSAGYRRDGYDRDDEAEATKAKIPEHLKPLHERSTIQPAVKEVVVLSDEESDDVPMVDIVLNPKAPETSTSTEADRLAESNVQQNTGRLDELDEDEEIEWEPSDDESKQPTAPGDLSAQPDMDMEYDAALDSEEEQLIHQLEAENAEHARFASTFNSKSAAENALDYDRELRALRDQQKKDRRDADEVTQIMIQECQQLLQMFGIPYITAPMEAEAQCAELVQLGLVDGIVTDDSDIFLFGGMRVYKNMFNQAKFVECYLATDLENEYSLDRKKLIRLAHLLGSDYTEGLPNVGPVTALEILAEFGGGDDALHEFRAWWTKIQSGISDPGDDRSKLKKSLKKLSDKLFLPMSFPDDRVDAAYLNPEVDKDTTPFEWGIPDLQGLRNFLMATIGWTSDRTDEVLVPVIRDMNRKVTESNQVNITNFFSGSSGAGAFAPRVRDANKSKRMENALMSLHRQSVKRQGSSISATGEGDPSKQDDSSSVDEEEVGIVSLNGRVRVSAGGKGEKRAKKKRKTEADSGDTESSGDESDVEVVKVAKPKAKRKAKAAGRPVKAAVRGRGRKK
ncbi:DNA repair protein rad2 [Orbilia brochopaga]|uniref:DNA repair protein rad2 n=1 Tax=Orbilia brochopaga TaxID=3140254 RepID=A0AAV9UUV1_9PEZI